MTRSQNARRRWGLQAAAVTAAAILAAAMAPAVREEPAEGAIRFQRPPASGVDFKLDNSTTPDKPIIDTVLGGVAAIDYDQDGFIDMYFANGASIPSLAKNDRRFWNRLYRNNGDGTFTDTT